MSWYPRVDAGTQSLYRSMPKVELHRHMEGSLRIETLKEIAQQHDIPLPAANFHALVQMQESDPLTFSNFLSKFATLRLFYRTPEVIERVACEAVEDAASDGVVYMEMRFTPVALTRAQGFSLGEVMDWVTASVAEASRKNNIQTRLIASVNRNESVELAEEVARLAVERVDRGITGIDLAGNEAEFPAAPFIGMMREACQSGLRLTIHGGEWGGAGNVRQAIEDFGAERVGHGVRVLEDPYTVELARERGTVFEVCVTSNFQSGVVPALSAHPLPRMLNAGLNATINTDDPSISAITLSDEYRLAVEDLGLTQAVLRERVIAAGQSAFMPPHEVVALVDRLRTAWDSFSNGAQP